MNQNEYVMFVIENRCNSNCGICWLEGTDGVVTDLHTVSFSFFKKFLKAIPKGKYSGVIFSGGEVTLNEQLPEYASYARDKGFCNIMIQTNGRALANLRKAKQLKDAGINQYLVSFHSADKDLSDRITGRVGAHAQTLKALENLEQLDLTVITNTVVNSINYKGLPAIGRFLRKFSNIVEMEFWGYVPVSSKAAELILPYALAAPYVNKTIKYLVDQGLEICIKYFPVCLLDAPYKKYHNNQQAANAFGVDDHFFTKINSCGFKNYPCCEGTDCWGLPEKYKSTMPQGHWMPIGSTGCSIGPVGALASLRKEYN